MTDKTETPADATKAAEEAAKLDKQTRPARSAKEELPANVVVTKEPNGTVIRNAVSVK